MNPESKPRNSRGRELTLPDQEVHRIHTARFHGLLGPAAKWRSSIIPQAATGRPHRRTGNGRSAPYKSAAIGSEYLKPKDLLEYVIVHEMIHLIEPTHSDRFVALLHEHYPTWREARMELNELPLGAERWAE